MKKFAVAYMNFFDSNLVVEVMEAKSWKKALPLHSLLEGYEKEYLDEICSKGIDNAKDAAFSDEWLFDVKEIVQ